MVRDRDARAVSELEGFPILGVEEVVELERELADSGTSLLTLMMRAGAAIAEAARDEARNPSSGRSSSGERHATSESAKVVVLCGSGNNGGDGWVAADLLAKDGFDVMLVTAKRPELIVAEPAHEAAMAAASGSLRILVDPTSEELAKAMEDADVAIDAILGTGFDGYDLKEPYASWVRMLNDGSGMRVIAADVPSGLSARDGHAAEPTVRADSTVTMLAVKPGLLRDEAAEYVGSLSLASLGVPIGKIPGFVKDPLKCERSAPSDGRETRRRHRLHASEQG